MAGKCAYTHFSCASSLVVCYFIFEIFLKDVTDVQRSAIFVQSCDGVLYNQRNLLVLIHLQIKLRSSNYSYMKKKKILKQRL